MVDSFVPFKLVLLGESAVGKTALVLRLVKDHFQYNTINTIGASFLQHNIITDNITYKINIWDTAGQERFQSLIPMYYKGAQAAIIVYDIQSHSSFIRAKLWVKELRKQVDLPDIVIALAGNKSDLENSRKVQYKEAEEYAQENGLLFMETSAKNAINVKEIFLEIAKNVPQVDVNKRRNTKRLQLENESIKTSRKCC